MIIFPLPIIIHGVPITGSSLIDGLGGLSSHIYDLVSGLGSTLLSSF
ncbi:hypothetical protein [Corynebacterium vitaeruminis]|nr:hypothetical protein [Corynebacterium vitaeruminis]